MLARERSGIRLVAPGRFEGHLFQLLHIYQSAKRAEVVERWFRALFPDFRK